MLPPRKTAYLAGPMRGLENFNFPAFYEAEYELNRAGLNVINPAKNGNRNLPGHMEQDAHAVAHCDLVAVLPGWEDSQGATLEVLMANYLGVPVYLAQSLYRDAGIPNVRVFKEPKTWDISLTQDPEIVDAREHVTINTSRCEFAAEEHMKSMPFSLRFDSEVERERAVRRFPRIPFAEDWPTTPTSVPAKTRFEELLGRMQELHDRKKSDYTGGAADILFNYRASGDLARIGVVKAIFARLCEKVVRVSSILGKGGDTQVQDETIMDTCLDLAIISLLLRIAFEEEEARNVKQASAAIAA